MRIFTYIEVCRHYLRQAICLLIALSIWTGLPLMGQVKSNSALLQREAFPPQLKAAVDALGSRVVKGGNERVTVAGILTKGKVPTTVRVTREMPNSIRIDAGPGNGRALGFDGNAPWASDQISDDDLDMAESLGDDAAESALYGLQNGSSLRLLGEHFRTDLGATANYRGPWVDIFEAINLRRSDPSTMRGRSIWYSIPIRSCCCTCATRFCAVRRR